MDRVAKEVVVYDPASVDSYAAAWVIWKKLGEDVGYCALDPEARSPVGTKVLVDARVDVPGICKSRILWGNFHAGEAVPDIIMYIYDSTTGDIGLPNGPAVMVGLAQHLGDHFSRWDLLNIEELAAEGAQHLPRKVEA